MLGGEGCGYRLALAVIQGAGRGSRLAVKEGRHVQFFCYLKTNVDQAAEPKTAKKQSAAETM